MRSKFTAKQIAELLDVSKPTVQKAINKAEIKPVEIKKNKFRFYSYDDTVRIIEKIKPSFDMETLEIVSDKPQNETAKPQISTEKPQNETAKPQNETAKPQNAEELELLRRTVAIIEKQLEEKDKQIKELSDRLAEALQLTKGQQYITAADKTSALLEADNKRNNREDVADLNEDLEEPAATIEPAAVAAETKEEEKPEENLGFWQRLIRKLV